MFYIFLADGFEELEATAPIDILKRGGVEVLTVGVYSHEVCGAHGIKYFTDITIDEVDLTKLDGTARGGVVLTIKNELGIPVKFIGVGEQIDDLQPFNPRAFADGLFEKIDYNEEDEKDGISQEDVAPDGQIIQAAGSQQIGHTDKDEQSGKDEDKKEEGKVKADDDAADESGVHGLEQSEKDIEDAPSDAEKPKKKKEKKRFGFFNRHS